MLNDITQIIYYLHIGNRKAADEFIKDLKIRSTFLEETVQSQVLIFVEQIHFQYEYDPNHKVTLEVQQTADKLIEELGFRSPPDL